VSLIEAKGAKTGAKPVAKNDVAAAKNGKGARGVAPNGKKPAAAAKKPAGTEAKTPLSALPEAFWRALGAGKGLSALPSLTDKLWHLPEQSVPENEEPDPMLFAEDGSGASDRVPEAHGVKAAPGGGT